MSRAHELTTAIATWLESQGGDTRVDELLADHTVELLELIERALPPSAETPREERRGIIVPSGPPKAAPSTLPGVSPDDVRAIVAMVDAQSKAIIAYRIGQTPKGEAFAAVDQGREALGRVRAALAPRGKGTRV